MMRNDELLMVSRCIGDGVNAYFEVKSEATSAYAGEAGPKIVMSRAGREREAEIKYCWLSFSIVLALYQCNCGAGSFC
jgi:hypothetical protein